MIFKNGTRVFLCSFDLVTPEDLEKITAGNTYLISELENISQTTQADPRIYSDSANSINSYVDRGVLANPGSQTTYQITLDTNFCSSTNVTNNEQLWSYFLSGLGGDEAVKSGTISEQAKTQQLRSFSLIVISGNFSTIYRNCVVGQASFNFSLGSLTKVSWLIFSGGCFGTEKLRVENGALKYEQASLSYTKDSSLEHFLNKTILTRVDGFSTNINLATTSIALTMSHNVSITPNEGIDVVGDLASYKLGSFVTSGQLSLYYKIGDCSRFLQKLKSDYEQFSASQNKTVTLILKSRTRTVNIKLNNTALFSPSVGYEQVYVVGIPFVVNNYKTSAGVQIIRAS